MIYFRGIFKIFLSACLALGLTHVSWAETLVEFLHRMAPIRVVMDEEGLGMGNQSAAIGVIEGLRVLGYTGPIQLVVPKTREPLLPMLLPPYQIQTTNSRVNLRTEYGTIEIITVPTRREQGPGPSVNYYPLERVPLAVMGAYTYPLSSRVLAAENVLLLQPPYWGSSEGSSGSMQVAGLTTPLGHLRNYFMSLLPETPLRTDLFLSQQLDHDPRLQRLSSGLQAVLESLDRIDMITVYGHVFRSVPPFEPTRVIPIQRGFARLASSLFEAVSERPDLFNKPMVIPIFNSLTGPDIAQARILVSQYFPRRSRAVHASSEELPRILASAQPGEVVFVFVGPIPRSLFRYFERRAFLRIVEGANTINEAHQLGLPFLPSDNGGRMVLEGFRLFPEIENFLPDNLSRLAAMGNQGLAVRAWADLVGIRSPHVSGGLRDFLIGLKSSASLAQMFHDATVPSRNPERDKLAVSLDLMHRAVRASEASGDLSYSRFLSGISCGVEFTPL